jgi:hypothetical protein
VRNCFGAKVAEPSTAVTVSLADSASRSLSTEGRVSTGVPSDDPAWSVADGARSQARVSARTPFRSSPLSRRPRSSSAARMVPFPETMLAYMSHDRDGDAIVRVEVWTGGSRDVRFGFGEVDVTHCMQTFAFSRVLRVMVHDVDDPSCVVGVVELGLRCMPVSSGVVQLSAAASEGGEDASLGLRRSALPFASPSGSVGRVVVSVSQARVTVERLVLLDTMRMVACLYDGGAVSSAVTEVGEWVGGLAPASWPQSNATELCFPAQPLPPSLKLSFQLWSADGDSLVGEGVIDVRDLVECFGCGEEVTVPIRETAQSCNEIAEVSVTLSSSWDAVKRTEAVAGRDTELADEVTGTLSLLGTYRRCCSYLAALLAVVVTRCRCECAGASDGHFCAAGAEIRAYFCSQQNVALTTGRGAALQPGDGVVLSDAEPTSVHFTVASQPSCVLRLEAWEAVTSVQRRLFGSAFVDVSEFLKTSRPLAERRLILRGTRGRTVRYDVCSC